MSRGSKRNRSRAKKGMFGQLSKYAIGQNKKVARKINKNDVERKHGKVISVPIDEYIHSMSDYSNDEIKIGAASDTSSVARTSETNHLSADDINFAIKSWSLQELTSLWNDRDLRVGDRLGGALLLAFLRFKKGIDSSLKDYSEYLGHSLIKDLPEVDLQYKEIFPAERDLETTNERKVDYVRQTIRLGQSVFRDNLIKYYGLKCMDTGETVNSVIEAAHILPYNGKKTNLLSNGLLLRVDIHRLYDTNLLSIEPNSLTIRMDEKLMNSSYWVYNRRPLQFCVTPQILYEFLSKRWIEFNSSN